ncbi:hypothetical protein BRAS3843_670103 [Bradyrhizobium sp. STM 3843]|nr:hypothetical protein BRAS3843_670103 [Bradyrhizobium sp. STM 3843]
MEPTIFYTGIRFGGDRVSNCSRNQDSKTGRNLKSETKAKDTPGSATLKTGEIGAARAGNGDAPRPALPQANIRRDRSKS